MNKKQVIRLTEADFHKIVKESVKRVLMEGFYDSDDDNEIFDIGESNTYKVSWEIKARGNTLYSYNTIDDGEKIVHSKDEAYNIFNQIKERHKDRYATKLRIEQLIKTYSDNRWKIVYDESNAVIE